VTDDRPRIVVVGSTMVDLVAFADRLPEPGETVVGTRFHQGFGGKGANQAVMAARFDADVAMVAAVGADPNGTAILANLEAQGVGVTDVATVEATSGVAPIWVDGAGMNRIVIIPGANRLVDGERAAAPLRRPRPALVLGQFEIPQPATAAAFRAAHEVGAVTLLNPAPGAPIAPDLLAATDWLVPNETEFVTIGGSALGGSIEDEDDAIAELAERLGVGLIVTLGERGAAIRERGTDVIRIPSPPAVALDTTGAGDAFVGAFAVGLARGWPSVPAGRLGCAAASDSVTRIGTQTSFADRVGAARLLATIASR
jgi:ribokinase